VKGHPFEQGFDIRLVPDKLCEPLKWPSPKIVFVNSMSDLFHEEIPTDYILRVFNVMKFTPWHTYQVLTKRPDRMKSLLKGEGRFISTCKNIWWGVTVENMKCISRVDTLRDIPVDTRFLSLEPLLENLQLNLSGIHWAIVGGESGPRARPIEKSWVENILRQCQKAHVPFFFKQWGGVHKSTTGRTLNGKIYDEMPKPSSVPILPRADRMKTIENIERAMESSVIDDMGN